MANQKPNIVLIMSDQLCSSALGCYGSEMGNTPHIDRLAEEGVRFENFYCNNPMCCSSRASMFSGMYSSEVGVYDNGAEFSSEIPTFLHGLKSQGYMNYLAGKAHFIGPDQLHGFDARLTREIYPPTFIWTPDWLKPVAINYGSNISSVKESGSCQRSLQLDYDDTVLYESLKFLRGEARRQGDDTASPFFLNVSFTHPHDPFYMPEKYLERIDSSKVEAPRPDWGELTEHQYNKWINRHHGHEEIHLTDIEISKARKAYYAACSYIDDCVGSILEELNSLGLKDNTVVIFTSDHGEMLGEHGMWFKRTFFEEAVKVPFLVSWPGSVAKNGVVGRTSSLIDLFATICELSGVGPEFLEGCQHQGSSLLSNLVQPEPSDDGVVIVEYLGEGTMEPLRMVVKDGLKLVEVRNNQPILIDLTIDPFEKKNVINNAEYSTRLEVLRRILNTGWDPDAVYERVVRGQTRRRTINSAAYGKNEPRWEWVNRTEEHGSIIKLNSQKESQDQRFPRWTSE